MHCFIFKLISYQFLKKNILVTVPQLDWGRQGKGIILAILVGRIHQLQSLESKLDVVVESSCPILTMCKQLPNLKTIIDETHSQKIIMNALLLPS